MSGKEFLADVLEIKFFILKLKEKIQREGLTPDIAYITDKTGLDWRQ